MNIWDKMHLNSTKSDDISRYDEYEFDRMMDEAEAELVNDTVSNGSQLPSAVTDPKKKVEFHVCLI
jgi:hypothetical protein